ncbi:MAG: SprT-like domain-containing protein, partial [Vicinamibacteria bacterium]
LWAVPGLEAKSRIEWSSRLTRSMGRAFPDRRLIRIASFLSTSDEPLLEEILCHEMAHLATRELYGPKARPHGPEWKALVVKAGFEPRTRLPSPNGSAPSSRKRGRRFFYVHRCPVCQISRTARRVVRRWRCAACVASGLEGRLHITRRER